MARLFDITTTTDALMLDERGNGRIVFTVTNTTQRTQRATLKLVAMDAGQPGWLKITGDSEREFAPGFTHQVEGVVSATSSGSPIEKFRIRLDAISVEEPEENWVSGPSINVIPKVKTTEGPKPGIPWWVWLIICLIILVVGGVVAFLALREPASTPPGPTPASSPASTSQPQPQPQPQPSKEFNDPRIRVGSENLALDVCREWGTNCGKPAADAFCAANGTVAAIDFRMAMDSPPTAIVSSHQVCRDAGCDRITWIRCSVRQDFKVQINPATLLRLKELPAKGKSVPQ